MNTLPRAITATFYPNRATYEALQKHWSRLVNSENRASLTAAHYLLYLVLLGKDWRKAFTPLRRTTKLDNGAFPGWAMFWATGALHSKSGQADLLAPFGGLVTPEMLEAVRRLVPVPSPYHYRPEEFAGNTYPFEAYNLPIATRSAAHA